MATRYAYLGPQGTFAEAALRALPAAAGAELVPAVSVPAAIDLVREGQVDGALIPIENSVEGSVATTLDGLATGAHLEIVAEIAIPVEFALLARPGVRLESIKRLATHPHAHAQCLGWLQAHLPGVQVLPAMSTARAAAELSADANYDAAICSAVAAQHYGLEILAHGIGDADAAWTRFVLIGRPGTGAQRTGRDKTTLVLYMREDHPGALLEILTQFTVRGINLTRIESRPTKKALGDYFFSVDLEGHIEDERVSEALMGLHRICKEVRFLGSYERHDGHEPSVLDTMSDESFRTAKSWLNQLRNQR